MLRICSQHLESEAAPARLRACKRVPPVVREPQRAGLSPRPTLAATRSTPEAAWRCLLLLTLLLMLLLLLLLLLASREQCGALRRAAGG